MNANSKLVVQRWQDETALSRFKMIAPLCDGAIDPAKRVQLRREIASANDLSYKTIKRYDNAYQAQGFEGLKPKDRMPRESKKLPENYDDLLQEAIQLRREVPSRSVDKIITILELENRVAPGILKRSTLQRRLYEAGFGSTHLKVYKEAQESSSKRFCKPHRMMLLQGDIKYGPKLPIGKNGALVQTYLSSAIDDHSRMVLSSRFYDNQEELVVEETFRDAILKYGAFDACYFDNGSQYVARQLKLSLARLSIRVRHAPVKSGKSIFLDEYYHKKPHEGISEYYSSIGACVPAGGITPEQEWNRDTRALKYLDAKLVGEAFMHHENRKVNKGACISFRGNQYETKASLIGFTVEIAYDPASPEIITVRYPGIEPFQAAPLKIGEYCDQKLALPASMLTVEPETSRFLDALEKKHEESARKRADAISFGAYRKEVSADV